MILSCVSKTEKIMGFPLVPKSANTRLSWVYTYSPVIFFLLPRQSPKTAEIARLQFVTNGDRKMPREYQKNYEGASSSIVIGTIPHHSPFTTNAT